MKRIREILRIYPQYWEPVRYYDSLALTQYLGTQWQFVFHYGVQKEHRVVWLTAPPKPLPFGPLIEPRPGK